MTKIEDLIPLSEVQDQLTMQHKLDNLKLVAQALEFLAETWPTIPGASVTLSPTQQDELKQIILALPLMVAV